MKPIGITTTVPIEILLAAGYQPLDLNNLFISDPHPERLLRAAERAGFPLNTCAWIKGIYSVAVEKGLPAVLGVTTGDCSNTLMLLEVLRLKGVETIPFAYPAEPKAGAVRRALAELAARLGTTMAAAERVRKKLQPARSLAGELDRLTWQENRVSGFENHYWLVSSSDFNGDVAEYEADLGAIITKAKSRKPYPADMLRLAFTGVPATFGAELYPFLEEHGAHVVFNEIQRQFAMPGSHGSLTGQYAGYTYPYSIRGRLADIKSECVRRNVDGVIHYVQAFCHRAIGDIVFRNTLKYPILTLEGNTEFALTQHLRTRLEAFLDVARARKYKK